MSQFSNLTPLERKNIFASKKFVIIQARYNDSITSSLRKAAIETLQEYGVKEFETHQVPGAFELPLAAKWAIKSLSPDAVIALGCVIYGDTPHFDFVCNETARGLMEVGLAANTPVSFGVLTTDDYQQAQDRATGDSNKGREAALSALEMVALKNQLYTNP